MQLGYPISTWLNPHMAGHSGQDERRVRWYTGPTAVRCLLLEVIGRRARLAPSLLEEHCSMKLPGIHLYSPFLFWQLPACTTSEAASKSCQKSLYRLASRFAYVISLVRSHCTLRVASNSIFSSKTGFQKNPDPV